MDDFDSLVLDLFFETNDSLVEILIDAARGEKGAEVRGNASNAEHYSNRVRAAQKVLLERLDS
jgi:hypothetical protein